MASLPALHIWLVSPYHTGSHRAWARGYGRYSRHRITLLSMPGRFWKWRMQGGAIELAAKGRHTASQAGIPDLILATDMLNVPAFLALARDYLPGHLPLVLYMHENQLTYPLQAGEKRDLTYAMITWMSQLAADRILFNSRYHLDCWFEELPRLLKHFPDFNHLSRIDRVYSRCTVLPVGIECDRLDRDRAEQESGEPPLILWNQRWEYDKRPDRFFALLQDLADEGLDFRVAVAGENFRQVPQEFQEARQRLARRVVHWGYVPSRSGYADLLSRADLVISTADHEFFGISVLEAIWAGAFPLLPNRLSYPELMPPALHPACLYDDPAQLRRLARHRLAAPRPAPPSLREHIRERFDWPGVAAAYDRTLEDLVAGRSSAGG